MSSAGNLQLCADQASGYEAAVHAVSDIFNEESTDALLLVDADNAFSSLNRKVLLHNIIHLCPSEIVIDHHRACLYLVELKSSEGTTQGDPMAMPVYVIGITPLLVVIKPATLEVSKMKHVCFADYLQVQ